MNFLFQTDGRTAEHPHPSCYTYDVFDGPMHFCQSARAVILYVYQRDNGGKIVLKKLFLKIGLKFFNLLLFNASKKLNFRNKEYTFYKMFLSHKKHKA